MSTDIIAASSSSVLTSPSGIAKAEFVEDVNSYMGAKLSESQTVDAVFSKLDEKLQKYKLFEINLLERKKILKNKIVEISSNIDVLVKLMKSRDDARDTESLFMLSDNLFSKAIIPPSDHVSLWLGAQVMLEYTLEEAEELLKPKLEDAKMKLKDVENDLEFLREQYTIVEVSIARVHNWNVKQRQKLREA